MLFFPTFAFLYLFNLKLKKLFTTEYGKRIINHNTAYCFKQFHDPCMVRSSEIQHRQAVP